MSNVACAAACMLVTPWAVAQVAPPGTTSAPAGEPSEAPVASEKTPETPPPPAPAPTETAPPEAPKPAAPEPAPAVTTAPEAPPPALPSGVKVEIISKHYVDLERRDHAGAEWRLVCHMDSCDRVPSDGEYRITADGMPPSDAFRLAAHGDHATLKVRPGNESKRTAGFVVLGAGGVLTLGGIVAFAVGVAPSSTFQSGGTHTKNTDAISVGSGLILLGVAAGLTGASWAYNGSRTIVGGDMTPIPNNPQRDASRRKPIAKRSYHFHESVQPPLWEIPVLGGTF